jgi:hypothetical protein
MIYGHRPRASAASDSVKRALERAAGMWGGYQAWHQLDAERRFALVEQMLNPAPSTTEPCCSQAL